MTLKEAYQYGQQQLEDAKIDDAVLDAWYLLEFVTGISRAQYFLRMDEKMPLEQVVQYREYVEARAKHIPLQHITGVQEFMGLEFKVNEHVLIPRQDTEVLVESVLEILEPEMDILDMCTGSGCIIISLLKLSNYAKVSGTGVDVSVEALQVANENAEQIGVDVKFLHSDLFSGVEGKFDVIVSNPPYIRTEVIEELQDEVKLHDPYIALDGREDGLYFYRKIVEKSPEFLKPRGKLYFEIGHGQGCDVKSLMENAGFQDVTVKKDLAGLDRVVFGVYNM